MAFKKKEAVDKSAVAKKITAAKTTVTKTTKTSTGNEKAATESRNSLVSRRKTQYWDSIRKAMMEKFKYNNIHQTPILDKIVLSMGLGRRDIQKNREWLTTIAAQYAVVTKAKKSVSQFAVRKGHESGAMVTLRNNMMYHFMDRLYLALLNWKMFSGLNKRSITTHGNKTQISFGIPDMSIFQGIGVQGLKSEGLNVTIVSTCKSANEMIELLRQFDLPWRE
jgi:large subunit ribosomal protein L5